LGGAFTQLQRWVIVSIRLPTAGLSQIIRSSGSRPWRAWAEARLLLAIAAISGGLWALLSLGGEVAEGETAAFDKRIFGLLRLPGHPHSAIGPAWLSDVMRDLTALGGATVMTLTTVLAVTALLFHKRWKRAVVLGSVVVLAQVCDEVLKGVYNRPRPDFAVAGAYSYAQSFPSGHSTTSAALWLSLAMIAASFQDQPGHKAFWIAMAAIVVVGVGLSRVFLGVHWPTDVLAGWMLGACWALAGWLAWRWLDRTDAPAARAS
jgi:undecaprenyl-diphosphatase